MHQYALAVVQLRLVAHLQYVNTTGLTVPKENVLITRLYMCVKTNASDVWQAHVR